MADPVAGIDLVNPPVDVSAPIDERDVALVQATWKRAAGLGAETVGKVLIAQILQAAPEAIALFPFKEYPPDRLFKVGSPLVEYGAQVVHTVNVAIQLLNDLPALVPVLKIALPGLFPGAQKEHYWVVGQAALDSLAIALGGNWTDAVKSSWLKIWTTIVSVMFPDPVAEEQPKADEGDPAAKAAADVDAKKTMEEEAKKAEDKKKAEAKKKAAAEAKKKAAAEAKRKSDAQKKDQNFLQCCMMGDLKKARALLKEGVSPDLTDNAGYTGLHIAAKEGHEDLVGGLAMEKGVKINAAHAETGNTPLHLACMYDQKSAAVILVRSKGIQMNAKNKDGKTPIDLAQGQLKEWMSGDNPAGTTPPWQGKKL